MFGQIQLEKFDETRLPQKAQSAWDGANLNELVGATYKPLLYLGAQQVNGTLYWYIAENIIPYKTEVRHVIKMAILEHGGEYKFVEESVMVII